EAMGQSRALVERPHGTPERGFEGSLLPGGKALRGVGVADAAAEARDAVLVDFPQRPAAVRAREAGDGTGLRVTERARVRRLLRRHGFGGEWADRLVDERAHAGDKLLDGQDLGCRHVLRGALGHARVERVARVLNEGGAPSGSDGRKTARSIV